MSIISDRGHEINPKDIVLPLDDLADAPRWVAWREEVRTRKDGTEYKTKIPYDPNNDRLARIPTDSSTWGTRKEAERRWRKIDDGSRGGVGIVLGQLKDGHALMGIDLDRCFNKKGITDCAVEIIKRFASYAEVSPSGQGVKLFFLANPSRRARIKQLLIGKTRKAFTAGEHREIAIDLERFYAVTDDYVEPLKTLRVVKVEDVRWLIEEAGPAFLERYRPAGNKTSTPGDESGSGHGFRFMRERKAAGDDYETARKVLREDLTEAGEWARRSDERQLRRAWDAAKITNNHSWEDPDISLLDDRRGALPNFPIEVLRPPQLQDWVRRAAHGTGTTIDHVIAPLLGIAASLIGTARRAKAANSFSQPMTDWTGIVGFSGTGKSPGIDATKDALDQVEEQHRHEIDDRRREHELRVEEAKAAKAKWKADFDKAIDKKTIPPPKPPEADEPPPFTEPRLYVTDATIEKVAVLLQARPQGMLLIADELAGWFHNMSRYSGGQDNQFWLMSWNGKSHSIERMGRLPVKLDHLLIGIVGGMQPDKLAECFKGAADGMYARFLWSWPEQPPYRRLTDAIEEVDSKIVMMLDRLSRLAEVDRKDRRVPLSAKARAEFEDVRRHVHNNMDALDGREREWWAKVPAHVVRLAGTLAYMAWAFPTSDDKEPPPEPREILVQYVQAAADLILDYFWPHSRACLRQIGLTQRHADARRVLRWIRAKQLQQVRREDIRRDALSQRLDADETDNLLKHLERVGWLRQKSADEERHRGRPKLRWEVNPKLVIPE
jgi:hypothetical protein